MNRAILAAALMLLLTTALGAEEGFLPNGSMSQGAALPAGWGAPATDEGPGHVVAARDTAVFKEGPASLRLAAEGGAAKGSISRALPGIAGKDVAVSGWVRAEGKISFASLVLVCPGAEPAWNPLKEFGPAADWQWVNAHIRVPAGAEPTLLLTLQGEGRVWLDEAAILPGERYQPDPVLTEFTAAPAYAFLGWEKRPAPTGAGLRVEAPNCQGGFGCNVHADLAPFAERTPVLTLAAGPANKARALTINLSDADGTVHGYTFKLDGVAPGADARLPANDGASLKEPCKAGDAGKVPGFDMAQVTQLTVIGDWAANPIDVTLKRLEWVEPDEATLKAREALRVRLAKAEEARLKAEAEKARRKAELLAGAPHPEDGPDVRHVAAVAPDVLALSIQEKEFAFSPQVPYEPQAGDEVRHIGKEKVWVVEGGQVQEALKEVVVVRKEGGREVTLGRLAVNANRIKPDDKTTGQDLSVDTVEEPAAYRITGIDDPAWAQGAAPAQVWWKRKPNAYQSRAHEVEVYLKLPRPLAEGKSYRIDFVGVNVRQASLTYRHEPAKTRSTAVHVSAIGFRPDDPLKRAFLSQWLGTGGPQRYAEGLRFQVLDDASGKPVFSGTARRLIGADDKESFKAGRNYAKTDVLALDFAGVSQPGRYRVTVEGIGCSYPFPIAADAWAQAFRVSMMGLLHERSGIALGPPLTPFVRPRNMHPADGVKVFASTGSEIEGGSQDGVFKLLGERRTDRLLPDAWGGHMDAGDWDRNSRHPAEMWRLVDLYELFPAKAGALKLNLPANEVNNRIPDVLDEVLWNLELYRRLQAPDGGVGGGIESTSHPRPAEASWQESLYLSAYAPDPRASFIYAATAAKLSRALAASDKALADAYAASARKAWEWAAAHSSEFMAKLPAKEGGAPEFRNERNLASFEMWRLTGEAKFHDDFRATTWLAGGGDTGSQIKAIVSYARLPEGQGDAALRKAAREWVIKAADDSLAFADGNAFGVTVRVPQLPPIGFIGYLSTPETCIGPVLPYAWLLTHDPKYLAGAVRACQFSAGANPDNRAMTTGLGPDPVRYPLYIDHEITGQPVPPGITVYGISDPAENFGFDSWAYTWYLQKMIPAARTWPADESYWDIGIVPSSNEFTIHQTIMPTAFYWGFLAARE